MIVAPTQVPPEHVSGDVQGLLSSHGVPLSAFVSGGHAAPLPVHFSATSQPLLSAARQVTAGVAATNPSVGQAAFVPSQVSTTSQGPAAARQVTAGVAATNPSVGQAAFVPSQVSATSQGPAAARQVTAGLAATNPSVGQDLLAPSQTSALSHGPAAARQVTPAAFRVQPVGLVAAAHCWHWLLGSVVTSA